MYGDKDIIYRTHLILSSFGKIIIAATPRAYGSHDMDCRANLECQVYLSCFKPSHTVVGKRIAFLSSLNPWTWIARAIIL